MKPLPLSPFPSLQPNPHLRCPAHLSVPLVLSCPSFSSFQAGAECCAAAELDFDEWQEVLGKSDTHQNERFAALSRAIRGGLKRMLPDLRDLEDTIAIVRRNRQRSTVLSSARLLCLCSPLTSCSH